MTVTTDKKELTVEQKRLIKKYVDLLVEKKIRVLSKYLDVDCTCPPFSWRIGGIALHNLQERKQ